MSWAFITGWIVVSIKTSSIEKQLTELLPEMLVGLDKGQHIDVVVIDFGLCEGLRPSEP